MATAGADTVVAADRSVVAILASTALPTTYVAPGISSTFNLGPQHVAWTLELTITVGTITSIQWIIQGSSDGGTTWFTEAAEAYSAGTSTVKKNEHSVAIADLAATSDKIYVTYKRGAYPVYRVCFKETGNKTDELLVAVVRKIVGEHAG